MSHLDEAKASLARIAAAIRTVDARRAKWSEVAPVVRAALEEKLSVLNAGDGPDVRLFVEEGPGGGARFTVTFGQANTGLRTQAGDLVVEAGAALMIAPGLNGKIRFLFVQPSLRAVDAAGKTRSAELLAAHEPAALADPSLLDVHVAQLCDRAADGHWATSDDTTEPIGFI